jgi:hypothetical protein
MEWLRMVKEHCKDHFQASLKFYGEACKWWRSLDKDTIIYSTPHGNNLKNPSQINGLGIQKWRKCIEFTMN